MISLQDAIERKSHRDIVDQGVCIVINTCAAYHLHTLPPLLQSLDRARVPRECIHIVVGGAEECVDTADRVHFRTYNNIDDNGLIWISESSSTIPHPWFFYMHDTCKVGPQFWSRLQAALSIVKDIEDVVHSVKLHATYSMSMGLYKTDLFHRDDVQRYFQEKRNYDMSEETLMHIKRTCEDSAFRTFGTRHALHHTHGMTDNIVDSAFRLHPRREEYYAALDMYKYKRNFETYDTIEL